MSIQPIPGTTPIAQHTHGQILLATAADVNAAANNVQAPSATIKHPYDSADATKDLNQATFDRSYFENHVDNKTGFLGTIAAILCTIYYHLIARSGIGVDKEVVGKDSRLKERATIANLHTKRNALITALATFATASKGLIAKKDEHAFSGYTGASLTSAAINAREEIDSRISEYYTAFNKRVIQLTGCNVGAPEVAQKRALLMKAGLDDLRAAMSQYNIKHQEDPIAMLATPGTGWELIIKQQFAEQAYKNLKSITPETIIALGLPYLGEQAKIYLEVYQPTQLFQAGHPLFEAGKTVNHLVEQIRFDIASEESSKKFIAALGTVNADLKPREASVRTHINEKLTKEKAVQEQSKKEFAAAMKELRNICEESDKVPLAHENRIAQIEANVKLLNELYNAQIPEPTASYREFQQALHDIRKQFAANKGAERTKHPQYYSLFNTLDNLMYAASTGIHSDDASLERHREYYNKLVSCAANKVKLAKAQAEAVQSSVEALEAQLEDVSSVAADEVQTISKHLNYFTCPVLSYECLEDFVEAVLPQNGDANADFLRRVSRDESLEPPLPLGGRVITPEFFSFLEGSSKVQEPVFPLNGYDLQPKEDENNEQFAFSSPADTSLHPRSSTNAGTFLFSSPADTSSQELEV